MTSVSVSPGRQQAGNVLLVVGYAVAVWALARVVPMYRQRRQRRFFATEAATAGVAVGWALRGNALRSAANAGLVVIFATAWWIGGRRRNT